MQCLAVARDWQRKGYGKRLTAFAVNKILDSGYSSVVLHTLPGTTERRHCLRGWGSRSSRTVRTRRERVGPYRSAYDALEKSASLVTEIFAEVYGQARP